MTEGYDLLVAAGASLVGTKIFDAEDAPSESDAARFLEANREALRRARSALGGHCAVPLEYDQNFFEQHFDCLTPLRDLARSFKIEFNATVRDGDLSRAVEIGLDIFALANATRRGGLVTDQLVGLAIEGIAIDRLRGIRHRLSSVDAASLANALLGIDAQREPYEDVVARDRKWEATVGTADEQVDFLDMTPTPEEAEELGIDQEAAQAINEMLQAVADMPDDQRLSWQKRLDDRNLAMLRLLAVESALIAYHGDHQAYPADLAGLTPDWIAAVPTDPFTGVDFIYRQSTAGFVVYSPGPTGRDSGGSFAGWLDVESGRADLCVDMYDYNDTCCLAGPPGNSNHCDGVTLLVRWFAIVLMCVAACVTYGIIHDQITARICVEYFTIGHPPVFGTDDPTLLGIGWGIIATWWVGVLLGLPLASASLLGRWPKFDPRTLVRPIVIMMVCSFACAVVAGFVGWVAASNDWVEVEDSIPDLVPVAQHIPFLIDRWAHRASYLSGYVGGLVLIVWVLRSRRRQHLSGGT